MSFRAVRSQDKAVGLLRASLRKNRLPHGLLFAGPAAAEMRETAFDLAKALFCDKPKDGDACDECTQCRQVERGTHPDLAVVQPEEGTRSIKIEDIRGLIGRVALRPFQARSKMFLIDRADCMNDAAQNALLKTLEEPEGRTTIVLTTASPEALLPTVRSRIQTVHFVPPAELAVADPDTEQKKRAVLAFVFKRASGAIADPPDFGRMEKEEALALLDSLVAFFRSALMTRAGAGALAGLDDVMERGEAVRLFDAAALADAVETFAEAKGRLLDQVNARLVFASLWDKLEGAHAR
jgi:DNA polymerase III delta' subunit